jgi:GNAT superfamily N-acetyltransferase
MNEHYGNPATSAKDLVSWDGAVGGRPASAFGVRTATSDEMGWIIEQAAREGWNPGLHDAASFYAADPEGFFVAQRNGELLGCISAVRYGDGLGFIGLYIVREPYRGQGVGMALWREGMAHLAGCLVGLDGVPAQQANYARSGFVLAWGNQRFDGPVPERAPASNPHVVPLADVDFDALCADDRRVFPADRTAFLRAWVQQPGAVGRAWREGGRLRGWALARRCRDGYKIGPLVADEASIARTLADAVCAVLPPGERVALDVPLTHPDAVQIAHDLGLQPGFETARMYTGPAPRTEAQRVFGITSFELG